MAERERAAARREEAAAAAERRAADLRSDAAAEAVRIVRTLCSQLGAWQVVFPNQRHQLIDCSTSRICLL